MKILECYIESFGKLKNEHIAFSEGLNPIKRDNGWGKTTLSVFIKVMLFGMSDTKKTSLEENDRKHYLPWDTSAARGTLTFEVGSKQYRIERSFGAKPTDDTFTLYDVSTGKVTSDFSEKLGEELFGIDADGFERTVFLSERALTPRSENKSISAKLSDLVGCDGDIGVMDDAMKRLEEGRKFYYKKGGSGELANIKSKISDAERKIDRLNELEGLSDAADERMDDLRKEIRGLSEKRAKLTKEREGLALSEARASIEKRRADLRREIELLTKRREMILGFFGGDVPTRDETDAVVLKLSEAKSLEASAMAETVSTEYKTLTDYLRDRITDEEASKLRGAIYEAKSRKGAREALEAQNVAGRFTRRIPSHAELDRLIAAASGNSIKGKKRVNVSLIATGILLSAIGICLGLFANFVLFAVSVLGIAISVIGFIAGGGKKNNIDGDIFEEFYASISNTPAPAPDERLSDLLEMKEAIDKAEELRRLSVPCDAENTLIAISDRFPENSDEKIVFAEALLAKFDRMTVLSAAEGYKLAEKERRLTRALALRKEVEEFTEKFSEVGEDAITEIREKAKEYERIVAELAAKAREAEKFDEEYGKHEGDDIPPRSLEEIKRYEAEIEEKQTLAEREYAVTERKRREYASELETRDELAAELCELKESLDTHTENYNVILKTKDYLERAKDSMTAKYLGKTKEGFQKYTALIGGTEGERFEMSTDFGVSKFEGASTKSTEAYSRGTKDLYNLASRLALIDSLYEDEEPFIILDDPFVSFDDAKIKAALKLLHELGKNRQIIYFTCSESRND